MTSEDRLQAIDEAAELNGDKIECEDPQRLTLPKSHHLRATAQFDAVYKLKRRAGDDALLMFAAINNLPHCRLGMSVSKRTHGNAVRRNRIRRVIREAFRLEQHALPPGLDLVVVPRRQNSLDGLLPTYRKSFRRLAMKLAKRLV